MANSADFGGRGAFAGRGRGSFSGARGDFSQGSEGGGRGSFSGGRGDFAQNSEGGRGNFSGGRGNFNQQDGQNSGRGNFSGGRGDFSQNSEGGRGSFSGGRGNFNQGSEDGQSQRGSFRGGRGDFSQGSEGGRGNFSGGRGNFNQQDGQNSRGSFSGGRGDFAQNSEGGRGNFSGGRGDFTQGSEGGRENFSGGRGNFNQQDGQNSGRGNFSQNSEGGRGSFSGGRGNFNQGSEDGQSQRGNFRGGRGDSSQGSEGGRGSFSGGRGNFNQQDGQNSGRGNFSQNSEGGRGSFSGGRGNFNQGSEDGQSQRGNFRGGRGDFSQGSGRGSFSGGRGDFAQNSEGGRGNFSGGGRGNFNQQDGQNTRGSFSGGRGDFSQSSEGARGNFSRGSGRGNFSGGRGDFTQNSEGGRGNFNQESEDGQSHRGGFGGSRGRGGNFNQDRNYGEQENRGGGFTQNRTDAPAGDIGEQGDASQPVRAPMNFVPKSRDLDQLYKEDEESAAAYSEVVDNDDDVCIENSKCDVVRIQNWEEADFDPKLLENIKVRSKYTRPRKIQGAAIPFILDHFDVKAQAETGSGKTAAFVLPILDSCIKAKKSQGADRFESELATPYAIIIGPTRELVLQVYEQAQKFANETGVSVAKAYGQYNINRNHEEIRQGCDILVATVGRLKHFVLNEDIFVHKVRYLVLDEADRLLDQNFAVDIDAITNAPRFPPKEQRITALFSATFDNSVMEIADRMLKPDAVFITNKKNDPNKKIKQNFVLLDGQKSRLDVLTELLKEELEKVGATEKMRRTLVFVNTKRMSDMCALYLCQHGVPATSINGDRGQHLREQALSDFRNHVVSVLISTDVTARGIDIKHLDHVINFDLPQDSITYVHRIGRTGRITQGFATTFVDGSEPILVEITNMLRNMGPLPEQLEKLMGGAVAPSNFAAAPPSNFAAAAPQSSNARPQVAMKADDDW